MELWNCKWFNYFLHNRRQCISIGGTKSDDLVITHGAPQGSVLGPLLFRLYVNYFSNCSKLFDFHICADDTNRFYANRSLSELEVVINNNLISVASLLMANMLSLNINKTNFIIFCPTSQAN